MQDYALWVNCVLLQLYRNTSDHHTNFLKIFNFSITMIALYGFLIWILAKICPLLISVDRIYIVGISWGILILSLVMMNMMATTKFRFMFFALFFVIIGLCVIAIVTFLGFSSIQVFFLVVYFFLLCISYTVFICQQKIIVFVARFIIYMIFLCIIVLKPQLINPFIGIFPTDKLFESGLEYKLGNLNSSVIIKLAKISQKDFTLQNEYQKEHNVSFTELNAVHTTILTNKRELNNVLSFLFDKKKISNFKEILATLENNTSNLPNIIKKIDDKNNNRAMFFDMMQLLNLDFVGRADDIEYNIFRNFPFLSITPKDEEYQIFESQENQIKLKNILSIINWDNKLGLQSIKKVIDYDEILSDTIKSTSVIYSIILLLCIFSLQKTARKNSIIPS